MDEALIQSVLTQPLWSHAKLEEAARGKVNASCSDPPELEFEFWLNIKVDSAIREGTPVDVAIAYVLAQARAGEFG